MPVELPDGLEEEFAPDDYGIPWEDIAPPPRLMMPEGMRQPMVRSEISDYERMLQEQAAGQEAERQANMYGFLSRNVVEPWSLTPENPLGPVGSALRPLAKPVHAATEFAGNTGVGFVSDIGAGGIQSGEFPLLNQALGGQHVSNIDQTSGLGARIAEGAVRGAGEMVPGLAATSLGVPAPVAFGGQMGLSELERSGDIGRAITQGTVGALMPGIGELGAAGGAVLAGRAAGFVPEVFEKAALAAGEAGGRQVFLNALMAAGNAPGLIEAYQQDPLKGADMLAEQIGASLAFEAPHIPHMVRESFARQQGQRWLEDPSYLNQVDRLTTDIAQPQRPSRLELPESLKALAEHERESNAIQERQAAQVLRDVPEQPGQRAGQVPAEEGRAGIPPSELPPGNEGGAPRAEAPGEREVPLTQEHLAPAEGAKPEVARLSTSRFKNPLTGDPMGTTYHATPEDWAQWQKVQEDFAKAKAEGKDLSEVQDILKRNEAIKNKYGGMPPEAPKPGQEHLSPEEHADIGKRMAELISEGKANTQEFQDIWKQFEDLRRSTNIKRMVSQSENTYRQKFGNEHLTFEHEKFTTKGNGLLDERKLAQAIESGELNGGEAVNKLLLHLLKPDAAHPLEPIQIIDMSPYERQQFYGGSQFRGRFRLREGNREGIVQVLSKDNSGQTINQADFLQTLTHELVHNAVTSKYNQAPESLQGELDVLFAYAKEKAGGTEFEGHNTFKNVHEFLSEASSNPRIQNWLTNLEYKGGKGAAKNVWGKFVDLVHKLFGSPKDVSVSALGEAMRISSELEVIRREAHRDQFPPEVQEGPRPAEERLRPEEEKPPFRARGEDETLTQYAQARREYLGQAAPEGANPERLKALLEKQRSQLLVAQGAGEGPLQTVLKRQIRQTEALLKSAEERQKTLPMRPRAGEAGAINLQPLQAMFNNAAPAVKASWEKVKGFAEEAQKGAKELGEEAFKARKMTDYRRSVLNWSAKLQKSFGDAAAARVDIRERVPDKVRREGITNWIQADGDAATLQQRMAATTDKKLKAGYQAALTLTPAEVAVANEVRGRYNRLGQRGQGSGVLDTFKQNYVTQIWDLGSGVGGAERSTGRTLKEKFKFAKASSFPTFFDGEQAGYKPKTKDISELLPVYMHEMESVIAAREMVQQMSKGKASDGEPLVTKLGGGMSIPDTATEPGVTLVLPKSAKEDFSTYKTIPNQPALQGWKWVTKDSAGNNIFVKADVALHPEAYNRLKDVLGKSAIREWYQTPTTRLAAIPKGIVHFLDAFNSETKRTMLGLLAPFHQVQTGTHGLGHRVNPFGNIPKVNLTTDPRQMDAARHGLMLLPDRASQQQFMEGFRTSGLVSKIPGLGPVADMYSNYLFHQYIPGLKFKTYEAILERNNRVFEKQLQQGKLKAEDVKALSAEQANAAYGHLNWADFSVNPTILHIAQLGLLAPDFLAARTLFLGQALSGATGAKAGREQMLALSTLALSQAAAAFTAASLAGGEWDKNSPFEFTVGTRRYSIRSIPQDLTDMMHHGWQFLHSRLSPIIGKGALQFLSRVDYAGRKVTASQTAKELATQPIPISIRSLPGVRGVSGAERPGAIKWWEQMAGTVGLRIGRFDPNEKLADIHTKWLEQNKDPKVRADYERNLTAVYPISKYRSLDAALADRDPDASMKAIQELRPLVDHDADIKKRVRPTIGEGLGIMRKPIFHESKDLERKFVRSLEPEERILYERAIKRRREEWQFFLKLWAQRGARPPKEVTPVP
jgi:hypothetical protein